MKGKVISVLICFIVCFIATVCIAEDAVIKEITAEVAIIDPAGSQILVKIYSGKKDSRGDPHFEWFNVGFNPYQLEAIQLHQTTIVMPQFPDINGESEIGRGTTVTGCYIKFKNGKKIEVKLGDTVNWTVNMTSKKFIGIIKEKKEAQE